MSEDRDVVCSDCESTPVLRETPYREGTDYVVTCECDGREIGVSDCVSPSNLVEPVTGKWTNFDGDNPNYRDR